VVSEKEPTVRRTTLKWLAWFCLLAKSKILCSSCFCRSAVRSQSRMMSTGGRGCMQLHDANCMSRTFDSVLLHKSVMLPTSYLYFSPSSHEM